MSNTPIRRFGILLLLSATACSDGQELTNPSAATDRSLTANVQGGPGAVFLISNDPAGNAVLRFPRGADGTLEAATAFPTGGTGTGGGLGNQGALVLSPNGRFLFAVNPGSDEISVFAPRGSGLHLVETVPSGGSQPISLALHRDLLYVLNAGDAGNIAGFLVSPLGNLTAISGSSQPLSSPAADPAQIGFDPAGRFLVVTEKATNMLTLFQVDRNGVAGAPTAHPSQGQTPFGFAFNRGGILVVSEAFGGASGQSAVSSYRLGSEGSLTLISGSVGTTQSAACWIVITTNGRFRYTTNTGSANVSVFTVGHSGVVALLDPNGITGATGAGPIDAAIAGRFLYTLNSGAGSISGFAIQADGSLKLLGETTGVPPGANGLTSG